MEEEHQRRDEMKDDIITCVKGVNSNLMADKAKQISSRLNSVEYFFIELDLQSFPDEKQ